MKQTFLAKGNQLRKNKIIYFQVGDGLYGTVQVYIHMLLVRHIHFDSSGGEDKD
jgi:hypothetical protein